MATLHLAVAVVFGIINYGFAMLTVNVNPQRVLLKKGSAVVIDCAASGTAKPVTITWQYDGAAVVNTDEIKIFPNNTLYIKTLRHSNKGRYVCEAKIDSAHSTSATVKVEIAVIRKIPKMKDMIEFTGKDVTIECPEPYKPSNPEPVVRWTADGKPMPKDSRYSFGKRSLKISGLKKEDTHNYTCINENVAGTRNQTMHLQVYVPGQLKVSPKYLEKVEEHEARFHCVSFAVPPFPSKDFKWTKDNKLTIISNDRISVFPNGTLRIKKVQPSDNGTYACSSTMTSSSLQRLDYKDSFNLRVLKYLKFENGIVEKTKFLDRKSSKLQSIRCAFKGDGFVNIRWSKTGLAKLPSRMKKIGNSLIISDLQFKDGGEYTCMVNGRYNTINGKINVKVIEGAEFTKKPKNITLKEGGSGQTVCNGIGTPKPKISWAKAEADTALPKNFKVVKNTTLVVTNAELSNAGTYFCMIANGPTSSNVEFEVIVEKSDGNKDGKKGQASMGRTVGIAVGCAGAYILLVIGLMIYCRSRRARMLSRQGNIATEIEDGEFNKDLLPNGDEEYPMNGDLKNLEQWHFPREDIIKERNLGSGKYGKVYLAKARGINEGEIEVLVAVKELAAENEEARQAFDQELDMLMQLKHPNVIKLLGVSMKEFPLLMITEYSEHGDLKEFLVDSSKSGDAVSIASKIKVCSEIANAMDHLSANGIIHHDLACRNCLVVSKDCHVKVAFFSLSDDTYEADYCLYNGAHVPLRWLSPEALLDASYSEKSGVWAFGVVIWEIFSNGKQPYADKGNEEIIKSIKKKNQLETIKEMPDQLTSIMKDCLRRNPAERPKFADIVTKFEEMPGDSNV